MHPETPEAVRLAAAHVALEIRRHAEAISLAFGERRDDIDHVIRVALAPTRTQQRADPAKDGRAATWLCRFRIYSDLDNFAEPIADSDDDLEPGAPGTTLVKGLRAVADYGVQLAVAFHNVGMLSGLDDDTLDMKVNGLRPTLSRRGGNAVWRLQYNTPNSMKPGDPRHKCYLLRIDIERAETGSGNFRHPVTPTEAPIPKSWRSPLSQRDPGTPDYGDSSQ
jgi:hypothetical protein